VKKGKIDMAKLEITFENWTRLPIDSADFTPQRSIYDMAREFVKSIDPEIVVTFKEDEFYAISQSKIINLTFKPDEYDSLYDDFLMDRFGISMNPFLSGMLHEIGHIMTFDRQLDRERSIIYYLLDLDFEVERFRDFTNMYFAIPSEFEATKWGVEYYLSHKEQCDNFLKEIGYEAE
jgi:hypothetical protein